MLWPFLNRKIVAGLSNTGNMHGNVWQDSSSNNYHHPYTLCSLANHILFHFLFKWQVSPNYVDPQQNWILLIDTAFPFQLMYPHNLHPIFFKIMDHSSRFLRICLKTHCCISGINSSPQSADFWVSIFFSNFFFQNNPISPSYIFFMKCMLQKVIYYLHCTVYLLIDIAFSSVLFIITLYEFIHL